MRAAGTEEQLIRLIRYPVEPGLCDCRSVSTFAPRTGFSVGSSANGKTVKFSELVRWKVRLAE
ncbi:hypothetical protein A6U85_09820 [Agrobacterium sp. 13-626]|nr:hypothetical protein DXT98_08695 [Agrobacterium sp. ICMP 7243]OCJ01935.1 hypothetical protein A6U85_09820 [Agrobacterium sp. 13-626]OCJ10543.1 hypothetical protein A6U88_19655 [Agrobacterium sp. B131/95]